MSLLSFLSTGNILEGDFKGFYLIQFTGEMGPDFSPKMPVKSLTSQQIVRIHQLFRQAKFDDPSGDVRSLCGLLVFLLIQLFKLPHLM